MTPGVMGLIDTEKLEFKEVITFFLRHLTGDWGEVDEHDQQENERSLTIGCRLLSAYTLPTGEKLWIITEADRSVTTILLPSEY